VTELRIRRATVGDADELARVYRSTYRENRELGFPAKAGSATEEQVAEWITETRIYAAETGGDPIGAVRLEVTEPDRAKLSRLGVRDDRKGEGIGSRLLDHAEEVARDWGCTTIWLTTPGEHPSLPDLYRRRGYEETGPYPLEFREYDEIVMEKRIR